METQEENVSNVLSGIDTANSKTVIICDDDFLDGWKLISEMLRQFGERFLRPPFVLDFDIDDALECARAGYAACRHLSTKLNVKFDEIGGCYGAYVGGRRCEFLLKENGAFRHGIWPAAKDTLFVCLEKTGPFSYRGLGVISSGRVSELTLNLDSEGYFQIPQAVLYDFEKFVDWANKGNG